MVLVLFSRLVQLSLYQNYHQNDIMSKRADILVFFHSYVGIEDSHSAFIRFLYKMYSYPAYAYCLFLP